MTTQTAEDFDQQFRSYQSGFMIGRQVELAIGCSVLLFIICHICYNKFYVYNTTKLFMFCSMCYFIGMFVVLLHLPSNVAGQKYFYDRKCLQNDYHCIFNVLNKIQKNKTGQILCGLEAFINIFAYNVDIEYKQVGYLFAVLITYNVSCVISENYRNFMRTIFKMKRVIIVLVLMFVLILIPLLFTLTTKQFNADSFFYCYGPKGFKFQCSDPILKKTLVADLIFYCGLTKNPTTQWFYLGIVNQYIISLILFIFHFILLWQNNKKIKKIFILEQLYLTQKQRFLLNSGKISIIVFIIQGVLLGKSLILLYDKWITFNIVIHYIFDIYPFIFLFFYLKYNKQQKMVRSFLSRQDSLYSSSKKSKQKQMQENLDAPLQSQN